MPGVGSKAMTASTTPIVPMVTGAGFGNNLAAVFFDRARRSPLSLALVCGEHQLRYGDLLAQVEAFGDQLDACGIGAGDRVAYMGWNHPMLLVALLATAQRGGIFVPVNPRSAAEECAHILANCGARAILAGEEFTATLDALRPSLPMRDYLTFGPARAGWTAADVSALRGESPFSRKPLVATAADDVAVLLYTSGTTGRPKGVMLSHGNVWAALLNMMLLIQPTRESTLLAMAPMFHVAALVLALASFATGGRVVALPTFDADAAMRAIRDWKVTWTFGVPTMLQALEASPEFAGTDISDMLVMAAAAPVPVAMLERWMAAGARIVQGYGQTEATGGATFLEYGMARQKIGSAGLAFPLTEVQLRDVESGRVVAEAGVRGQIWIRGSNVTRGYWQLEDETRDAFDAEGWLASGDVGEYDADGYLYVVDRLKDMIISGGVNIYPAEIEKVLMRHANIAAVAVFGLPDERWGESIAAAVVSRDGAPVPLAEIEALCRGALAGYKCPRRVEMIDALPLNASGKVLKRVLRDRYAAVG